MNMIFLPKCDLIAHSQLMTTSFKRLYKHQLTNSQLDGQALVEDLFNAKFALLSHTKDADPIFNYANRTALNLFEFDWEELMTVPSRLSAEPINQAERAKLLEQVSSHGYIDDYQGVRISKTGKRFQIRNAIVWNLIDDNDTYQGQAACFSDWEFI